MNSISGANFLLSIYANANYANGLLILLAAGIQREEFCYEVDPVMPS